MAFNITNFRSQIKTFSQPNHFDMMFNGVPKGFNPSNPDIATFPYNSDNYFHNTGMRYRAFSTHLPGRTLDVVERRYSGPSRLIPTGYVYQALPISIYENHANNVKPFFDRWMSLIAENDYWFVKYYDDIIIPELRLHLYSKASTKDSANDATPIKTYILSEVFPISINSVQLDWNTTNAVTIINVEIQYHSWKLMDYVKYDDNFAQDFEDSNTRTNKTKPKNIKTKKSAPLLPNIPEQTPFSIDNIINRNPFSTN